MAGAGYPLIGLHIITRSVSCFGFSLCRSSLGLLPRSQPTIEGMLTTVGWPVLVAGLSTMAGFLSFLVMDLQPMQEFGWQMAMGTGICGVLALLVIPAFLVRYPITATRTNRVESNARRCVSCGRIRCQTAQRIYSRATGDRRRDIWNAAHGYRNSNGHWLLLQALNPPARADKFLTNKFSGSVFLQIFMEGDMTDQSSYSKLQRLKIDSIPSKG